MSEKGIVIPTWALPLVVSLFVGAVSYGAAQANAQATQEDVERVEKVVEKVVQDTNNNTHSDDGSISSTKASGSTLNVSEDGVAYESNCIGCSAGGVAGDNTRA